MKKTGKLLALALCVILCMSLIATAAFAAETEQDGLKLILTTDKDEYTYGEPIVATMKVENTAGFGYQKVNLKFEVPKNVDLVEGNKEKMVASLADGASETLVATFAAKKATSPDTGDFSLPLAAAAAAILSGALLVMLFGNRKRACLALALLLVVGLALPVSAASASGKVEVSATVKVEGTNVTLKAVVAHEGAEPEVYKSYTFNAASDNGYSTFFFHEGGVGPKGTASLERGTYQIQVTESTGTDWHIKFEKTIATKPGSDYTLRYSFTSTVAGTVMLNGKAIEIQAGANTVENTIAAVGGESLYTELQFGMLPAPFTVNISQVTVEESTGSDVYTNVTPASFRFDAAGVVFDQYGGGSQGSVSTTETFATLNITKPGEANGGQGGVWESKLFIKTGMDLKAGKRYKISIDLEAVNPYECLEICYNNGDVEKGVEALYGQTLDAGQKKTFSITVTPGEDKNDLTIQLQAGQFPAGITSNAITASNLVIKEISGTKTSQSTGYTFATQGIGSYHDAGAGCEGYLYTADGKLVLDMVKIGTVDWHSKMMIENVTLEGGKLYTVRFTAKADKNLSCAFFLNTQTGGWNPSISQTIHFTTEMQTYELKMSMPQNADDVVQLLWQFGSGANSALGGAKVEFGSIEILAVDAT